MAAPKPCPGCDGSGWCLYAVEGSGGEIERAYRLCGCTAGGTAAPIVCIVPSCRVAVPGGEHMCSRHLAEWDANAAAEDWQHAEEVLEAVAAAFRVIGLSHVDEAMQDALTAAKGSRIYYEGERDRIRERG